jgi:hypothetical protein
MPTLVDLTAELAGLTPIKRKEHEHLSPDNRQCLQDLVVKYNGVYGCGVLLAAHFQVTKAYVSKLRPSALVVAPPAAPPAGANGYLEYEDFDFDAIIASGQWDPDVDPPLSDEEISTAAPILSPPSSTGKKRRSRAVDSTYTAGPLEVQAMSAAEESTSSLSVFQQGIHILPHALFGPQRVPRLFVTAPEGTAVMVPYMHRWEVQDPGTVDATPPSGVEINKLITWLFSDTRLHVAGNAPFKAVKADEAALVFCVCLGRISLPELPVLVSRTFYLVHYPSLGIPTEGGIFALLPANVGEDNGHAFTLASRLRRAFSKGKHRLTSFRIKPCILGKCETGMFTPNFHSQGPGGDPLLSYEAQWNGYLRACGHEVAVRIDESIRVSNKRPIPTSIHLGLLERIISMGVGVQQIQAHFLLMAVTRRAVCTSWANISPASAVSGALLTDLVTTPPDGIVAPLRALTTREYMLQPEHFRRAMSITDVVNCLDVSVETASKGEAFSDKTLVAAIQMQSDPGWYVRPKLIRGLESASAAIGPDDDLHSSITPQQMCIDIDQLEGVLPILFETSDCNHKHGLLQHTVHCAQPCIDALPEAFRLGKCTVSKKRFFSSAYGEGGVDASSAGPTTLGKACSKTGPLPFRIRTWIALPTIFAAEPLDAYIGFEHDNGAQSVLWSALCAAGNASKNLHPASGVAECASPYSGCEIPGLIDETDSNLTFSAFNGVGFWLYTVAALATLMIKRQLRGKIVFADASFGGKSRPGGQYILDPACLGLSKEKNGRQGQS